ncbi:hypothetical protein PtA15_5A894 [Puccinia triticina]|nr:uncharacterized protein PtA15_5A894 [Puccinia triticina]WAQ85319.1 hypothetical protein PtA15_5A894 [Puccinia triticina]
MLEVTIEQSKKTETDVIEHFATHALGGIDRQLGNLISMLNPTSPLRYPFLSNFRHQPIVDLATTLIPFIKLHQSFYKKLTKHGIMSCRTLPSFTQMNSHQLKSLCGSAERIAPRLEELLMSLSQVDMNVRDRPVDIQHITEAVEHIANSVIFSLVSVLLYLVPLIDSVPEKNYYQGWFATWNAQINIAVQNFVQLAEDLQEEDDLE